MINLRLSVLICGKSVTRLQNKTIYEHVKYVLSVSRSAEITVAISLALHSILHALENFSGFTGFLSTPNGQNLTRL